MKAIAFGMLSLCLAGTPALADGPIILGVSISPFGKTNLCGQLGGSGQPPTITIRHSKGTGMITVSMEDRLSNGRTKSHGSTSVAAEASGSTRVAYSFNPPCNLTTHVSSAYYVTAASGGSSKTTLWGRYH
jgi:hypothetical protein